MRSIDSALGLRFRSLRKGTDMTQEQFLSVFNKKYNRAFTASAISQYENGKRIPEIDALVDFADHFGVSVGYLLGVEDTGNNSTVDLSGLSPDSQKKASEYVEMLRTVDEIDGGKNCIDFGKKA